MATGFVDSTVRDKQRGQEILSLLLMVVKPGSVVRVSNKTIRVDKSRCTRYTAIVSSEGQGVPVVGA